MPSLWEAALETEWRCFSKAVLGLNVTPNISKSSDSISTVPPIVNGDDWECIVHDLETIMVLVLLTFNFIPWRLHQSLTLTRSRFRDSATVALTTRNGATPSKWSHLYKVSAYSPDSKTSQRCTGGTITGPKPRNTALMTQRFAAYSDYRIPWHAAIDFW